MGERTSLRYPEDELRESLRAALAEADATRKREAKAARLHDERMTEARREIRRLRDQVDTMRRSSWVYLPWRGYVS